MKIKSYIAQWNLSRNKGRVILRLANKKKLPALDLDAADFAAVVSLLFNSDGRQDVYLRKDESGQAWLSTAELIE